MKLREWNAHLHGLVVFRALLNDPVVARLLDLTDRMEAGCSSYGPVCDAVAAFEAALFEYTTNWGSYLSAAVLEAETVCVRQAASGTLAPALQTALDSELAFLQALCVLTLDELLAWVGKYCEAVKPYITNTTAFLRDAQKAGKSILFEAQLGALRDLDYGIYPYTTSSNAVAAYAPVGSGLPTAKLDEVVGVVKAYSSCVGEGPFVCEMFGEEGQKLRDAGAEYGAKTGRPRRVGPIDLVATRYGVEVQGATNIALTKLDVLSSMKEIPVITGYTLDGVQVPSFDPLSDLDRVKPVVTTLPGWNKDISGCRSWAELPKEAKAYVEFLEKQLGHEIQFVSTGAEREKFVLKGEWL